MKKENDLGWQYTVRAYSIAAPLGLVSEGLVAVASDEMTQQAGDGYRLKHSHIADGYLICIFECKYDPSD